MNEVNARRARLVPGWVTVFGWVYHLGINQSINQSIMLFRVVQVTKSLQDPLEVGNSLLGISDNVRE